MEESGAHLFLKLHLSSPIRAAGIVSGDRLIGSRFIPARDVCVWSRGVAAESLQILEIVVLAAVVVSVTVSVSERVGESESLRVNGVSGVG